MRNYTASEVAALAEHIRTCEVCAPQGDPDIIADTFAEDLPPEELDGYIQSQHRWAGGLPDQAL